MPQTVNIHEAKTHLSRLLEDVQRGDTVIIAKAGRPLAQLTPLPRIDLAFGDLQGKVTWADDAFDSGDLAEMFDEDLGLR